MDQNAFPRKRGRPKTFTREKAELICDALVEGKSLRQICADPSTPSRSTIFRWLRESKDFADQYAIAKQLQIYDLYDELLDTARGRGANDESVQHKSMKIQALKWLITQLTAKKYRRRTAG
jgi:transposase-like protein